LETGSALKKCYSTGRTECLRLTWSQ